MRTLTVDSARVLHGLLRVTTCLLLLGHGALGALNNKPALTAQYASIGLQHVTMGGLTLTRMVGGVELVLVDTVLVAPLPSLLLGIGMWKMATEALCMTAGALPFEWIERAGSYMAPVALSYLVGTNSGRHHLPGQHQRGSPQGSDCLLPLVRHAAAAGECSPAHLGGFGAVCGD